MSSVQIKGFATTCLCSLHELLSFPRAQMAAKHAGNSPLPDLDNLHDPPEMPRIFAC